MIRLRFQIAIFAVCGLVLTLAAPAGAGAGDRQRGVEHRVVRFEEVQKELLDFPERTYHVGKRLGMGGSKVGIRIVKVSQGSLRGAPQIRKYPVVVRVICAPDLKKDAIVRYHVPGWEPVLIELKAGSVQPYQVVDLIRAKS